ncbi:TolC family protein, partial [Xanthovirga aplysinae]|uniref:TolC family protein n=1 Tax=Xanthovirga aplysinae TaxID=2529853 RepID=UPI001CA3D418
RKGLPFFSIQNKITSLDFSFPLFIRKARGELQLTKLKILQIDYQYELRQIQLINQVKANYNDLLVLNRQIKVYNRNVVNYGRLVAGERRRFQFGESSLFLLNRRELDYINAQFQLIDFQTRYLIALASLIWSAGRLYKLYIPDVPPEWGY